MVVLLVSWPIQMSLLNLPNELRFYITKNLAATSCIRDIKSLSETCHQLFNLLIPHLYRRDHEDYVNGVYRGTHEYYRTALDWAIGENREATVRRAIAVAPEVCRLVHLTMALERRFDGITEMLLGVEAIRNELRYAGDKYDGQDEKEDSPFVTAAFHGNEQAISLLLSIDNVNIDAIDHRNRTPLFAAACHGHSRLVRVLLNQGAIMTIADDFGQTVLETATTSPASNTQTVLTLLEHGAGSGEALQVLRLCVRLGLLDKVKLLLFHVAADMEPATQQELLLEAREAAQNSAEMVALLRDHGASERCGIHD